jgi:adenosine deaminase
MSRTGLGLASTELGNPPENYRHVFKTAGLLGLHKVAHAGETERESSRLCCLACQ